jgi:hypothetical protein
VEDRHRSVEFIGLLSDLDAKYPPECTIRVILDNHSAHISKETQAFLALHPNRFQYVLTPKHGSWLNTIACVPHRRDAVWQNGANLPAAHPSAISGRTQSADSQGHRGINAAPVVHRWKNFKAL